MYYIVANVHVRTGLEYASKLGPQLITFRNMIDSLQIDTNQHL